jgi:hypothetical protein
MNDIMSVEAWMRERRQSVADLVRLTQLDERVLEAIVRGRYTPSPDQRQRLAAALQVEAGQITWGHVAPVEHMYGHGPQFGRSP